MKNPLHADISLRTRSKACQTGCSKSVVFSRLRRGLGFLFPLLQPQGMPCFYFHAAFLDCAQFGNVIAWAKSSSSALMICSFAGVEAWWSGNLRLTDRYHTITPFSGKLFVELSPASTSFPAIRAHKHHIKGHECYFHPSFSQGGTFFWIR